MGLSDLEKHSFFPPQYPMGIPVETGDYDANSNLIYQGFFNYTSNLAHGVILKHTYDGQNRWTGTSRLIDVAWSDRTTLTFP